MEPVPAYDPPIGISALLAVTMLVTMAICPRKAVVKDNALDIRMVAWQLHIPAEEIVSSVGAGDAFCASILYALHEGIPMEQAIRMGNAAAWFNLHNATSTGGAPTLEELNRFLSNHQ